MVRTLVPAGLTAFRRARVVDSGGAPVLLGQGADASSPRWTGRMGKVHGMFLRALALALLACACAQADVARKRFDIADQSAAAALNEFARQADITLIFSYDLVAGDRTRELKGRYTVDHGLTRLLDGTRLAYRQVEDGTYLICRRDACEPLPAEGAASPSGQKMNKGRSGGNASAARLHDSQATVPGA